jgi:hypothetical protein
VLRAGAFALMGALLAKDDTVELPPGLEGGEDNMDMDVSSCPLLFRVVTALWRHSQLTLQMAPIGDGRDA